MNSEIRRRFSDGQNKEILKAPEVMSPKLVVNNPTKFLSLDNLQGFCKHYKVEVSEIEIVVAKNYLKNTKQKSDISLFDLYTLLPSSMFPKLKKILQIARTIPVSSASSERSFSVLKRLKTYLGIP
ncbi:hypothetical protein PR048_023753 [Dryococelus australis]|uniref:HAT C-terminal dimerisation domain-containing protein n=1 Tax=Dryococelus australis TaxID=614101 RepID=A0ABQ9GUZ2_9NEOP|nr:hypothetical protein PR048_023753 [Dryococelus australis]